MYDHTNHTCVYGCYSAFLQHSTLGYINSSTSPTTCTTTTISDPNPNHSASQMQRSLSSQSFLFHNNGFYPPVSSLPDLDVGPFRRVFSTGDLAEVVNQEQEERNKAVRYNPEKRRERIEKYRRKRKRRNFNKKIQYACRKTLADTRPRIRGRFARDEEMETFDYSTVVQWNQIEGEEEDDTWIHLLD